MIGTRERIQVLHVDDEPDFAGLAADFIERHDDRIEVETAKSAKQGLELFDQKEFDCIISDYDMPGQNGIEFLETIREEYPDLPFILYTGKGSEEVASEAISSGVTAYVQKGTGTSQYDVLVNRIRNAVAQYRSEIELEATEHRYQRLIEEASDAIFIVNPDGNFEYVSPAAEDVLGYAPSELHGENGFDFIHPEDRERAMERFSRMVDDPSFRATAEFRFERPDGSWIWLEARGRNLLEDPEIGGLVVYTRDVTDRKERERHQERYETIIEALADPVYAMDSNGRYTFVNEAFVEKTGYSRSEIIGEHASTVVPEEYVQKGRSVIKEVLMEDDRWSATWELERRTADGKLIPAENHAAVLTNEDGDFRGTAGVIRDITERKQLEQELERFTTLFEHSTDAIALIKYRDETPVIQDANPVFESLFVPKECDITDQDIDEVVASDDSRDEANAISERVREGELVQRQLTRETVDGPRTFDCEVLPVEDRDTGSIESAFAIYRDTTERLQQEERFQAFVEQSTDIVSVLNPDGTYAYQSPAVERILGYDPEAMIGENAFEYVHPEDREDVMATFERAVADPDTLPTVEFRFQHADGSWRWLKSRGNNQLENPAIEGFVVNSRDITEQIERERERRESAQRYRALFESSSAVILEEDFSEVKQHLDSIEAEQDDLEAYFESNPEAINELMDRVEIMNATQRALEYYNADSKTELVENIANRFTDEAYEANKEIACRLAEGQTEFRVKTVSKLPNGAPKHEVLDVAVPDAYADDYARVYLTVTDITPEVERERTLERLQESARQFVTADIPGQVAQEVAEAANDILGYAYPVVRYRDGNQLVPAYAVQELKEEADTIPSYRIGEELAGEAFAAGEIRVYEDVREVDDDIDRGVTRSVMYVPIGDHGVISVADTEPDSFTETDVTYVELLASHARTALDLINQQQELKQQNERLDEFAGIVSHDLRNPLNVADGRLALAMEECDNEHLQADAQALGRMETLIEDTLTQAQAGETIGETELVELPKVVESCWSNVETTSATTITETTSVIEADIARLRQLLENLFRNAVEHAGEEVTITIGDLPDGFYVEDDGPGIPEEEQGSIFAAGYSTAEEGTGFGLRIVREITEAHGWEIAVSDSEAGGARFEISDVEIPES
ncbi:MAG: PAS domain S-box protein [Halobacteriales archaeon]